MIPFILPWTPPSLFFPHSPIIKPSPALPIRPGPGQSPQAPRAKPKPMSPGQAQAQNASRRIQNSQAAGDKPSPVSPSQGFLLRQGQDNPSRLPPSQARASLIRQPSSGRHPETPLRPGQGQSPQASLRRVFLQVCPMGDREVDHKAPRGTQC